MPEQAAEPQPAEVSSEPGVETRADAPSIAPDHEAPKPDAPMPDAPKAEAPKVEPPRLVVPKLDMPKAEEPKPEEPKLHEPKPELKPGKLIVMGSSDRAWDHPDPQVKAEPKDTGGKRRLSAMAAVVALAAVVGAISGALATAGVMHFAANQAAAPAPVADTSALEASVARIDADVVALKAGLDHTSKSATGQFNKTSDRLDKLEKAQAEPAAKLAKLSDAVDKLRSAQAAAPAQTTAAKETTGSIAPAQAAAQVAAATPVAVPAAAPAQAAVPLPVPKPEIGRLPTLEGWRLRDVANGGALIEGRGGLYEVYAGDPVPGLGRIDAIRRQDGRWVVVTSKGLIVAR
ncbi:hypothetical protein QA640_06125 [Bradyrhizobium sp. CB82]|uniref:hypothetical protein n=1 Tax=Bradyrhizobium sp. CB82 TaxID=3039159 RepID=UPI0024B2261B|nr:hypothetical protein [Bradyrhizobium sp. CB82]WFU44960.1 hypothetical protein QA640_06125 [Bradyrhizobium sp. CB82]